MKPLSTHQYLIVGFPGLVARCVLRELLRSEPKASIAVLVEKATTARRLKAEMESAGVTVEVLRGSPEAVDLGLPGPVYMELVARLDRIIWCLPPEVPSARQLERAPAVRGAAECMELARACRALKGGAFLSSIVVMGDVRGVVTEADLSVGQRFANRFEESAALAEQIVERGQGSIPMTIARAAPVLGDFETGDCPRDGFMSRLAETLASAPSTLTVQPSYLPVRGVTADFVARALLRLCDGAAARFRRVHLLDPDPPTDAEFLRLAAGACGRVIEERPQQGLFQRPSTPLRRIDVPERRALGGWEVEFDRSNAHEVLSDLPHPPADQYIPRLVAACSGERWGDGNERSDEESPAPASNDAHHGKQQTNRG